MNYLIIDGMFGGTGIRDANEGAYLSSAELELSNALTNRLEKWLLGYEEEHYNNYANKSKIEKLDIEGKEIALAIKNEIREVKIAYFSSGFMTKEELMYSLDGNFIWIKTS